jgi:hypothetical protein
MSRVFNVLVETDSNCMVTPQMQYTYKCTRCNRINELLKISGFGLAYKYKRTLRIEPGEFTSECIGCLQKEVIRTTIYEEGKE